MKFLTRCCIALMVTSPFFLLAQTGRWPVVQPLHEKQTFNDIAKKETDTTLRAFVKDYNGIPTYKLECHNEYYDDDSEIDFSGAFQCALFAVEGNKLKTGNLLAV